MYIRVMIQSSWQYQRDAQAAVVVFRKHRSTVLFGDLRDQRQAEAAVFFAVQGVVALKEARQGVVRHGRARRVVQGDAGFVAGLADGKGDGAAFRGGAESGELSSVFTFHHLKVDYKN